jgi:L-glutamine-phosphate cytidylyltransferase
MLAVILCAGVGRRLAPLSEKIPKALIEVGGRPLIFHTLEALRECGVNNVVLVVGHLRTLMQQELVNGVPGVTIHWVVNDLFAQTGSLYSLWSAKEYLTGPFVFMDADLLFNPGILADLTDQEDKSCLLVGPLAVDSGEEVKVAQRRGLATAIGKIVDSLDPLAGEAVGVVKIAAPDVPLALQLMDDLVRANQLAEHEELSQALCDRQCLWVRDIGDSSWLEIDFPEDVVRARDVVWPAIQRERQSEVANSEMANGEKKE